MLCPSQVHEVKEESGAVAMEVDARVVAQVWDAEGGSEAAAAVVAVTAKLLVASAVEAQHLFEVAAAAVQWTAVATGSASLSVGVLPSEPQRNPSYQQAQ